MTRALCSILGVGHCPGSAHGTMHARLTSETRKLFRTIQSTCSHYRLPTRRTQQVFDSGLRAAPDKVGKGRSDGLVKRPVDLAFFISLRSFKSRSRQPRANSWRSALSTSLRYRRRSQAIVWTVFPATCSRRGVNIAPNANIPTLTAPKPPIAPAWPTGTRETSSTLVTPLPGAFQADRQWHLRN